MRSVLGVLTFLGRSAVSVPPPTGFRAGPENFTMPTIREFIVTPEEDIASGLALVDDKSQVGEPRVLLAAAGKGSLTDLQLGDELVCVAGK